MSNDDRRSLVTGPTIVVGLNDIERTASSADLRFAATEAVARGAGLRLVHGAASSSPAGRIEDYVTRERMHYGEHVLAVAAEISRGLTGGNVEVTTVNSTELGADVLLAESVWAALVVLHCTPGRHPGSLLDHPTIGTIAARASCPVVIIPVDEEHHHPTASVAVALADRSPGREMVLVAASEARRRRVPLTVVQVRGAPFEAATAAGHVRASQLEGAATGAVVAGSLSDALAAVATDYPDVAVRTTLIRGPVADALVDITRQSVLLIIARNGAPRSSDPGLALMPRSLITRARCPVMVMPSAPDLSGARRVGSALAGR